MPAKIKSENWLIIELGVALIGIIVLSFFRVPSYEKAVWFLVGVLATQFGNVIGYKFGRSMPDQKPPEPPKADGAKG